MEGSLDRVEMRPNKVNSWFLVTKIDEKYMVGWKNVLG